MGQEEDRVANPPGRDTEPTSAGGFRARLFKHRWLIAVLLLALATRLAVMALADDYVPQFDAADYARHAESIAAGSGFPESQLAGGGPSAFRPPGYPYFLGAVFALSDDSVTAGRLANGLLGVLAVFFVWVIGSRLWGRRAATVAAALAAVFPPLVFEATSIMSESLFVVLVLLAVTAGLFAQGSENPWPWAAFIGFACGLAALTRSNGLLLLLPLALAVWTAIGGSTRRRLAGMGLTAVIAVITVTPWALRNADAFPGSVPISTQGGYGLAGVYNDAARANEDFPATWLAPQFDGPFVPLFDRTDIDEAELDGRLQDAAISYAWDNPEYVLKVSGLNALRLLDVIDSRSEVTLRSGGSTLSETANELGRWSTWLVLIGAVGGFVWLARERRWVWERAFVWLVPLLMVLPAVPVLGGPRYRAPADPFLCLLASLAILAIVARLRGRDPSSADALR